MPARFLVAFLISSSIMTAAAWGQDKPAGGAPVGDGSTAAVVAREVNGLSGADFAKREEALKHLQTLVAGQLKQRAQIQEVINAFEAELEQQQHALAMVSDEEAQAQIAGLLEMERGLTSWTIQTMGETPERRKALLEWGLTSEVGPTLARVYAGSLRVRLDGITQLAKLKGDDVDWTIGRLVGDNETAVRTAAMAACWSRPASGELINALWYRAVSGPLALGESARGMDTMEGRMMLEMQGMSPENNSIKVDFPGGDPIEYDDSSEVGEFYDSQLASAVLVHMNSPIVAEKIKALVAERVKAGKTLSLSTDEDWTLVTHRLVEAYQVKEAIPVLASEALGAESDDMTAVMTGRTFAWSRRTMAIGALAKLIGKDPGDFGLVRAKDQGDPRGWEWGVEINRQQMMNGTGDGDGAAVRAFYGFWKDHHGEYGVTEVPRADNVPKPGQNPNQAGPMPGRVRGRPMPVDGPMPDGPGLEPDGPAAPAGAPGTAPDGPALRGGAAG